jgi:hypothetical protein
MKILLKLLTSIIFITAILVFGSADIRADGVGYYQSADPDCPVVSYGPWFGTQTCDFCVTMDEWCWADCDDVYFYENYPGCQNTGEGSADDLNQCHRMCDDAMHMCFRDGPCIS